jgi:chaperone required for assembly of F1-ATPase
MKRFYEEVAVSADGEGFTVTLDGRPIRTPAKNPLRLPTAGLAEAIAAEWRAQGEEIDPTTMPMMRFASTAIDRVSGRRDEVIGEVAAFGASDLLCYRADEPAELAALQAKTWQPLLDWAARRFGAPLKVTAGIMHVAQDDEALAALRNAVDAHDPWAITALHTVTSAAGSLVIGLALLDGELSAEQAWEVSQVDESFQAETWGQDSEAMQRRRALKTDLENAARFHALSRK